MYIYIYIYIYIYLCVYKTVGLHCQTPTLTHACPCREAVCSIFYDGLWYDPTGTRTHDLPCERRTR